MENSPGMLPQKQLNRSINPFNQIRVSRLFARFYDFLFTLRTKSAPIDMPGKKTIVFSPHPDDETLGCGGVIRIKKDNQAKVKIVYLTDGSNSHPNFFQSDLLADLRKIEAKEACSKLGVPETDLVFLDIPDSQIKNYQEILTEKIRSILEQFQPEEIFIPHRLEETADHYYTYKIISSLVKEMPNAIRVYEYLIWAWMQWPYISPKYLNKSKIKFVKNMIRSAAGLRLLISTNCRVNIINQLELKRATMDVYLSQTQPVKNDTTYNTLKNYCGGEFLNLCVQPQEYFRLRGKNGRN